MKLEINGAFEEALYSKHKYLVLYGGAGSGKSVFAAQKILIRLLSETPHKFLVVRKVARTLRESVFALFKKIIFEELEMENEFKINESNMSIEYLKNGNRIIFFGLDNPEKIKSIAGITGIWIEEVTELKKNDFDQLDIRLRGETAHYKQIILTFNPVSAYHWIKKEFFDKKVKNCLVLKTTYLDNPFINEEYKETFERIKTDNYDYYKIYALGHWGSLKGLIYEHYEVVEEMPKYFEKEYIGIDFGYNHPFAIVHIRLEKNFLYIDEILYKTGIENSKIVEWAKNSAPWMKKIQIYADSARPDLINEWRVAGFRIEKANKSVFEGINIVKSFKLKITQRSTNILKEIGLYCWKEDKEGEKLDEPVKLNDDAMDAIRYSLTPYIKKSGKTKSFQLRGL